MDAAEIAATLQVLALPPPSDVAGRLRSIYAMVAHEVATTAGGSDDALLALASHAGSERGKTALLVTLLRAPAYRRAPSRDSSCGVARRHARSVGRAWAGGAWVPLSPRARSSRRALRRSSRCARVRSRASRRRAPKPSPITTRRCASTCAPKNWRDDVPANRVLRALSLYRLPVDTQAALRLLLALPLGALVVAIFRNLIGVPTFGTFMPVLIAFALRNVPIYVGLAMVVA